MLTPQAAVNAAEVSGGEVRVVWGTFLLTATLNWKYGTSIEGGYGQAALVGRYPEFQWAGPAGSPMIQTEELGVGEVAHQQFMRRMRIIGTAASRPSHGIEYLNRPDAFTTLEDIQFGGLNGNAIRCAEGTLNFWLRRLRWDGIGDYAIYIKGASNLILDTFTFDNTRADLAASGGLCHIDLSADDGPFSAHFMNGTHLEQGTTFATDEALFKFTLKPAAGNRPAIHAKFETVSFGPNGGLTNSQPILVTPATDFVDITLENCRGMDVNGVPSQGGSIAGTTGPYHARIQPHGSTAQAASTAERTAFEVWGDTNLSALFQYGVLNTGPLLTTVGAAGWDANPVTLEVGKLLYDPALSIEGQSPQWVNVVTRRGTLGTLTGVTGTGTTGTLFLVCNDVTNLRLGQEITIGGVDNRIIRLIDASTKTLTLNSNLSTTHTDAAVAFRAPATKEIYIPQRMSAAPTSGTWRRGDVIFNSVAGDAGVTRGWICTLGGTPGTWTALDPANLLGSSNSWTGVNTFVNGLKVDVVATGSLPAAGASMDGRVLIENVGAGDRNLIIYAGGERFRLDGGATF
jgi:hypothetical protein